MSHTGTLVRPDPRYALPKPLEAMQPLTLVDTCDRCGPGSTAYVQVRVNGTVLRFCAHHFASHESAIAAGGYEVKDERDRLYAAERAFKGTTGGNA